ncbi:hypothetical protein CLU79DRAFT_777973 [Phycomyces nitens]|nr:hypothetical protein CLU79DRAFT_777973 [Phycomyces nitens]
MNQSCSNEPFTYLYPESINHISPRQSPSRIGMFGLAQPADSPQNPSFYDLQQVIQQYKSQPELLKLILTSKVEEDKRRAEEAKLRAKELDLYLSQTIPSREDQDVVPRQKRRLSSLASEPSSSSSSSTCLSPSHQDSVEHHQKRRNSAAAAMLAMGTLTLHPPSPSFSATQSYPSPVTDYEIHDPKHGSDTTTGSEDDDDDERLTLSGRPRRRREMQAITKIVETREFPYLDNFFWKNNGNTTQKKTGCKSVYYKCSNSNKGCPVNKTVTGRPNGEYLIKYRGRHLLECGRVERIRDL